MHVGAVVLQPSGLFELLLLLVELLLLALVVVAVGVFPKQLCCGVLSDWVVAELRLKENMWIASANVVVIWAGLVHALSTHMLLKQTSCVFAA